MLPKPLLDILEPAYRPCRHFDGACAGACMWEPSRGLVPCAFGGALGSLDEVRLIIVTAEPGDPPDRTGYEGTPQDMVLNSVRIFREAMERGGLERAGRPTPFHRNMRRILDTFWPTDGLDVQLRKTWTTNAVLCPAAVAGGNHIASVESACTTTYLARQLNLFPNAFVLALGCKARNRMKAAGLKFDAVGLHPSARASDADKQASWTTAAQLFLGEGAESCAHPAASRQPPFPPLAVNRGIRVRRQELSTDLQAAISSLPRGAADFFSRLDSHPEYDCRAGRLLLMVFFRGAKLGGLNPQAEHWYFSKVFVRKHGAPQTLLAHGFNHVIHNRKHAYWMRQGLGEQGSFEEAMVAMTGVRP